MDTQGQGYVFMSKIAALILELNAQKATIELVSGPYIDDAGRLWLIKYYFKSVSELNQNAAPTKASANAFK